MSGKPGIRQRLLARRLLTWEARWGRDIVEQFELGAELVAVGILGTIGFMVVFMVASSLSVQWLRQAALFAVFCGSFWVFVAGAILVTKATQRIPARYGLPQTAGKSLTLKTTRDPALFDRWLQTNGRTPDGRPGTPN